MPRLIAILVLFGLAFWIALLAGAAGGPRSRDPRTYRPKPRWGMPGGGDGGRGMAHVMHRRDLEGLRDAYSSAPIDPAQPLLRCGGCQAMYHADSVAALDRQNHGRCSVCGGTDLAAVHVVAD
jgi:hypothetical protein